MSRSFKRLERVLKLEAEQGFQDKAVVGGIRQFATFWVSQARDEATAEVDKVLVEQVAEVLMGYARLPGLEARAEAIDNLLAKLDQRANQQPPKAAAASPTTARPPQERTRPTSSTPPEKETRKEPEAPRNTAPPERKPPTQPREKPAVNPDPEGLQQPVTILHGVGKNIAQKLEKLGANTIWDLLYTFPRRYDDYTLLKPINRLQYGEVVTVIGTIWETRARRTRTNNALTQTIISDGTGKVQITWYNQPWLAEKLKTGTQIAISGKVEQYLGRPVFQSPEWEPVSPDMLKAGKIVPVYPLTNGLSGHKMRAILKAVADHWSSRVPDPLPETLIKKRRFFTLSQALQQIHFPDSQRDLHRAQERLTFDELFLLQLGMLGVRKQWQANPGIPISTDMAALVQFRESLPFQLTEAQRRVIMEITEDMTREVPMNRLLQGDVGSGKTVVAAAAMLVAVKAGYQTSMMAPTEILAEQHFNGLSRMLAPLGVEIRLLTGSTTPSQKEAIYADLANGTAQIAIGTHALIQEGVKFQKLALAIIDEQHRFGVDQRQALRKKGAPRNGAQSPQLTPHLLVMTATPIPRTLALSIYGDLDLSLLDEMPPGRQEIKTRWLAPRERERAYAFVRGQIEKGRQAYIICPLVEDTGKVEAKAAVDEHSRLQGEVFPDLKLGLLHGRMKSSEKEEVMRDFYAGKLNILVSTSVIEVGVDVPNSTVMLIEGANRFGLAQLHQFRGRVGRGEHQSYCLLIAETNTKDAQERLAALEQTNDGFVLAEKDMEIRGPGQFFGRRQSGLPELQMASLTDMKMLQLARREAEALFEQDPELEAPEYAQLRAQVARFWQQSGDAS